MTNILDALSLKALKDNPKVKLRFLSLAVTALIGLILSGFLQIQAAQFPLKVSADGRHLEDQSGTPFLINGDTPWSLIVGLTKTEAEQYLEDRRSRGFNSIIVELIEHYYGGPANRDGELPFIPLDNFAQPNELYFQHADWVINKAAEKGLLVVLTPAYIGYNCGSEGWCQEMLATSLNDLKAYGNYLGNRYKGNDNIIWMHGGDAAAGDWGALEHVNAIADGIRQADPAKLFTAHSSHLNSAIESYNETGLDINNTYSYCDWAASETKSDYERSPTIPFFFAEGRYEGESGYGQCIRSQAYWSVLGGSIGHFLGNRPIWLFDTGWQQALDSPGSNNMTHFGKLFASRPWSLLVPDYDEIVVSGNRNSINSLNYIMAARASDGSFIMAYFPEGGTVTVDMSTISGSAANVWWFDPEVGNSQLIGNFTSNLSKDFTTPDNSDWVLVVDNADKGFSPPGADLTLTAQCEDGVDNDLDGAIDFPADPGCTDMNDNNESDDPLLPAQCGDGVDNDLDGIIDFPGDPGCTDMNDNNESDDPLLPAQCGDGVDNDLDGVIDFPADPGCTDMNDNNESDDPLLPAQCEDGIDNDLDGVIDFPTDPNCVDALDNDESHAPLTVEDKDQSTSAGSFSPGALMYLLSAYIILSLRRRLY